jgi:hypothetical protein
MNLKRTTLGLMAILLSTSTVLATPISTPLGCQDGTRNEPQPPTIIPAWVEVVPDIQHDGWIEVVPDIFHPEVVTPQPDLIIKSRTQKTRWEKDVGDVCVYPNGWRNISYKADCLTMHDTRSMASVVSVRKVKIIPQPPIVEPVYTEIVPDIEHPAYVEEVADIEHPEQVIPNPDLVIDTKTIKYKDVTFSTRPPFVIIDFHYETTDGTCH